MVKIGIIGGSGLDDPKLLSNFKEIEVETPYGKPASVLTTGKIANTEVVILARHGKKHELMPTKVPFQANIWALKEQGCSHILATTACGSLREEIKPGDFVFLDQFIDRTTQRKSTLYEDKVCHIPMAEPFCPQLRKLLVETAKELGLQHHEKGTVVTIEGPRFGTKAESHLFRQWKADVVNMTTIPEVVLAREAGMCYQAIAMSTDYDCFLENRPEVTIDEVLRVIKQNADNVKKLLLAVIPKIKFESCSCMESYKTAFI